MPAVSAVVPLPIVSSETSSMRLVDGLGENRYVFRANSRPREGDCATDCIVLVIRVVTNCAERRRGDELGHNGSWLSQRSLYARDCLSVLLLVAETIPGTKSYCASSGRAGEGKSNTDKYGSEVLATH